MARIELDVSNNRPCSESDPDASGEYIANLHRWGPRGIEHSFIPLGKHEPGALPIGELMQVMLRVAEERVRPYRTKEEVPLERLIGMNVLRACMHPFTTPGGMSDNHLQIERVSAYGFVPDLVHIYPAEYSGVGQHVSENGVTTHLRVHLPDSDPLVGAQHLLATPLEQREYPVSHATISLAGVRKFKDAWLALRVQPDQERYVETLVPYEMLMDTLEL